MQDSVDADLRAMTAELEKARKTIARQRGQLRGLSENLMSERAENARLRDHIFKLELDMEHDEAEEERRHDDAASGLEQCVAFMTMNPRGAAATRGRRCGNRSRAAAIWRGGRGHGGRGSTAASSVAIDAPQGTDVNISLHY